jgi:hypothetical protein
MKVSSSKFTFSLLAAALFLGGSGLLVSDSFAAAPTFTAITNSSTTTEVKFSEATNGTLMLSTWFVDGVVVTGATNGTTPSAANILHNGANSLGSLNDTTFILLTHAAVDNSGSTPTVQYINIRTDDARQDLYSGAAVNILADRVANATVTSVDGQQPTALSAHTTSAKTIEIMMSEPVGSINGTYAEFSISGYSYGAAANTGKLYANNGSSIMYLTLQNAIDFRDTFTLAYTTGDYWITDATNTPLGDASRVAGAANYNNSGDNSLIDSNADSAKVLTYVNGIGNRLQTFTGLTIENNQNALSNDVGCYDCSAPVITNVELSVPSANPMNISFDDPVHVNTEIGDTVSISVTINDNKGGASIPYAGLYTNFISSPNMDNLFYTNNFDSLEQMSTTYYEWNITSDDIAFDLNNSVSWDDASATTDPNTQTKTVTFTMSFDEAMESSQVWIDIADMSGNYLKVALPITLKVNGDPSLTFASSENQKVTSFFNDTVLLSIISAFDVSSDNTSELSAALGIEEGTLPTWTTELATWASEDKIDIADMVIAVEYVINQ